MDNFCINCRTVMTVKKDTTDIEGKLCTIFQCEKCLYYIIKRRYYQKKARIYNDEIIAPTVNDKIENFKIYLQEKIEYVEDKKSYIIEKELIDDYFKWCNINKRSFNKYTIQKLSDYGAIRKRKIINGKSIVVWQYVKFDQ